MKNITPVIKKTRVKTSTYEVCPHCMCEIGEKENYIDDENYIYHRPCQDKGPIGIFHPMSKEEFRTQFKDSPYFTGKFASHYKKTVQAQYIQSTSGTMNQNIAGIDYVIEWSAKANRNRITATVEKPQGMSDYMWYQVKGAMRAEAMKQAKELFVKNNMVRSASSGIKINKISWLERAAGLEDRDIDNEEDTESIDNGLLSDGLGVFCDKFVNYTSGNEGNKLAKWIIAICKDPKFSNVSKKLESLHNLIGEIYQEVEDIAIQDNER